MNKQIQIMMVSKEFFRITIKIKDKQSGSFVQKLPNYYWLVLDPTFYLIIQKYKYIRIYVTMNWRIKSQKIELTNRLMRQAAVCGLMLSWMACGIQVDLSKNYVTNGDFQSPRLNNYNWRYFQGSIPGWSSIHYIQLGIGSFYNPKIKSGQVLELDAERNEIVKQEVNLPQNGHYALRFQQSCKPNYVYTSEMNVYWNGKVIYASKAPNDEVYARQIQIQGNKGMNNLQFLGTDPSDLHGMLIDNVEIYKIKKTPNSNYNRNTNYYLPIQDSPPIFLPDKNSNPNGESRFDLLRPSLQSMPINEDSNNVYQQGKSLKLFRNNPLFNFGQRNSDFTPY